MLKGSSIFWTDAYPPFTPTNWRFFLVSLPPVWKPQPFFFMIDLRLVVGEVSSKIQNKRLIKQLCHDYQWSFPTSSNKLQSSLLHLMSCNATDEPGHNLDEPALPPLKCGSQTPPRDWENKGRVLGIRYVPCRYKIYLIIYFFVLSFKIVIYWQSPIYTF